LPHVLRLVIHGKNWYFLPGGLKKYRGI
jgi:hypothetical protein